MTRRARLCAGNNADLYQLVFSAHGLKYTRAEDAFCALDPPPPYYSPMTITQPVSAKRLQALCAAQNQQHGRIVGFKDSFCQLPADNHELKPLFKADWLWRAPLNTVAPWDIITTECELRDWETAWKSAGSNTSRLMFPASLLAVPDITFFAKWSGNGVVAGCIANQSAACVGLSNVFALSEPAEHFAQAADCAASLNRTKPLVGYEHGAPLAHAQMAGLCSVGKLRVWTGPLHQADSTI